MQLNLRRKNEIKFTQAALTTSHLWGGEEGLNLSNSTGNEKLMLWESTQQRVIFSENTLSCYKTEERRVDSKKERKEEKEKEKQYMKQKKEEKMWEEVSLEITVFIECLVIFYYVLLIAFVKLFVRLICDHFLQRRIMVGPVRNLRALQVCELLKLNPGLRGFWTQAMWFWITVCLRGLLVVTPSQEFPSILLCLASKQFSCGIPWKWRKGL